MSKKALLIGARPQPFIGPWVNLAPGVWKVDPGEYAENDLLLWIRYPDTGGDIITPLIQLLEVEGPCKMRVEIVKAGGGGLIHLDVELVKWH